MYLAMCYNEAIVTVLNSNEMILLLSKKKPDVIYLYIYVYISTSIDGHIVQFCT